MSEFHTVFHDKLMELYSNHVIRGRTIFPGAGYIEMGLAAGALMSTKGIEGGVELLDMKFIHPFDLEAGCKMVSNHHFGGGMEFCSESSEDNELTVASIGEINAGLSAPSLTTLLSDLKASHTQEVANIQDRYARLAEAGYHRGAFQSIKSVFLSEDGKSALGRIGLPEGFEHDHDAYYHAHPAVLDGAFQLIGFVAESMEGEAWVPAGISRVAMHRSGELHKQEQQIWAHVALVDDGPKMKTCDVSLFDEDGLIMSFESFRYARLGSSGPEASLFAAKWIQSSSSLRAVMDVKAVM